MPDTPLGRRVSVFVDAFQKAEARVEPAPDRPPADRTRGGIAYSGGAPGINAALEIDRDSAWTVVVLANDDPPTTSRMAKKVRRLLDAIQN